jgi:hypothetical protein
MGLYCDASSKHQTNRYVKLRVFKFWTLSFVAFFLFKKQGFGDLTLAPSSGKTLIQLSLVDRVSPYL